MILKLTAEQRAALDQYQGPVPIEDDQTHQVYFLVDASTLDALRRQQDLDAIQEGVSDMHAGRVAPLVEVMARIRTTLGLPQTQ